MRTSSIKTTLLCAALTCSGLAFADEPNNNTPSNQELYEIIQAQQEQIEAMQKNQGHGGDDALSIGGYGELHYNNIKDGDDEIDFHRFVLFFSYDFADDIRFVSELEIEHALAGNNKPGEVELEQAYIEFDLNQTTQIKGGIFLIPVGILNETHEPPTFYGVERNPVEKNIIPTTWWEGGVALNGELAPGSGFSYDVALHSGLSLNDSVGNRYKIRNGRQKVAEALANDFALTGRIKYTGTAGLEVAATLLYQDDVTQDTESEAVSATLFQTHAAYTTSRWGMRAFLAHWNLSGDKPESRGRDKQQGGYLEASFKPAEKVGIYGRFSHWDNEAGNRADTDWDRIEIGVNYWPHENVVIKFDIYDQEQNDSTDEQGFDLGIGYQFGN